MILTKLEEIRGAVPHGVKVGSCGFKLKGAGDMHKGHSDLVKALKSKADFVVANLWPDAGFYQMLANVPDRRKKDPYRLDIEYCADFLMKAGADVVWMAPENIHEQILAGYDPVELMVWAQTICLRNQYTFYDAGRTNNLYYHMITNKVNQEKQFYPKHIRAESLKDGVMALYRKHFTEQVLGLEFLLVEATMSPNGLPMSTRLKDKDKKYIDMLKNISEIFKTLDLKKRGEDLSEEAVRLIVESSAGQAGMEVENTYVYQNPAVGEGKSVVEIEVTGQYNSTYIYSAYIDHEKGKLL